jgi:hypothetical protein
MQPDLFHLSRTECGTSLISKSPPVIVYAGFLRWTSYCLRCFPQNTTSPHYCLTFYTDRARSETPISHSSSPQSSPTQPRSFTTGPVQSGGGLHADSSVSDGPELTGPSLDPRTALSDSRQPYPALRNQTSRSDSKRIPLCSSARGSILRSEFIVSPVSLFLNSLKR